MSKDNKLNCAIVCDLLPLYHDGVVSDITADAVKNHISDCKDCSQEYEKLSAELPTGEKDVSTKSKFSKMMRKARIKRIITTTLAVVLACAVLISAFFVLTQIPLVNIEDSEIEVYRVYRYEVNGAKRFFVLYSNPKHYNGITFGTIEVSNENDTYVLELNQKRTVISQKVKEPIIGEHAWIVDADYWEDFEVLKFGDEVIWTQNENADDEVPEYVYVYDEFEKGSSDITWVMSVDDGYLGAEYPDGRCVLWNIDGNVIYDEYPDESGDYPEYPYYKFPDVNG